MLLKKKKNEIFPTTNAADENFEVISETADSGRNNEFTISARGLLCETTSLLFRKRHEFHGSKSEKYFVQRFYASTKGTSFPLPYPEGDMFPSFVWSTVKGKFSIAGSIQLPLLSGLCKEDGFADIPTHVYSRLTNDYSSTSSYYRCAIFGHEYMCSSAANHCDMRQHNKWMTSSNTEAGGLDLRCKDDSKFPRSI